MEVSSTDLYVDGWGLRKLYGYAHRRQQDAAKREQVPNESSMLSCGVHWVEFKTKIGCVPAGFS